MLGPLEDCDIRQLCRLVEDFLPGLTHEDRAAEFEGRELQQYDLEELVGLEDGATGRHGCLISALC